MRLLPFSSKSTFEPRLILDLLASLPDLRRRSLDRGRLLPRSSLAFFAVGIRDSDQFQSAWNARADRLQLWKELALRDCSLQCAFEVRAADLANKSGPGLQVGFCLEHVQIFIEALRGIFKKPAEPLALRLP